MVWPRPQSPPTSEETQMLLRSLTIVETAARWSASTACLSPSTKPKARTGAAESGSVGVMGLLPETTQHGDTARTIRNFKAATLYAKPSIIEHTPPRPPRRSVDGVGLNFEKGCRQSTCNGVECLHAQRDSLPQPRGAPSGDARPAHTPDAPVGAAARLRDRPGHQGQLGRGAARRHRLALPCASPP